MEVLKLCVEQGVEAGNFEVPILDGEMAKRLAKDYRPKKRKKP